MSRARRDLLLMTFIAVAAACLVWLGVQPGIVRDPVAPKTAVALAQWLRDHPADVVAASGLSDQALDSRLAKRRELWLASFTNASYLSPRRPNARAGFVRAGLFHWYELDAADRRRVLEEAAPLMHEPRFFDRMLDPIWNLTHDFTYLRRVAPETVNALDALRLLAAGRGLFPEYRELRETTRRLILRNVLAQRAKIEHPGELLVLIPETLTTADEPLVRAVLQEFDARPFAPQLISARLDPVITFALDHHLQPLGGIQPLLEVPGALRDVTRARAALVLGDPTLASRVEITSEVPGAKEWVTYHVERALFEARRKDAAAAEAQLRRAETTGQTAQVLEGRLQVATLLGSLQVAETTREQLRSLARGPLEWSNGCGVNELCATVFTQRYVGSAQEAVTIGMSVVQSDETDPYVEIYANDRLLAEGTVPGERTFTVTPGAGLQRIEVRLVNRMTRNGVQRRVRLS